MLKAFWEGHDPTQGMRQGNDVGTQYRSAIYTTTDAQAEAVEASVRSYQAELEKAGTARSRRRWLRRASSTTPRTTTSSTCIRSRTATAAWAGPA